MTMKDRKIYRKAGRNIEANLKGTNEVDTETACKALKERHEDDKEITHILEKNKSVFRTRLLSGLPPNRKVDHRNETL